MKSHSHKQQQPLAKDVKALRQDKHPTSISTSTVIVYKTIFPIPAMCFVRTNGLN